MIFPNEAVSFFEEALNFEKEKRRNLLSEQPELSEKQPQISSMALDPELEDLDLEKLESDVRQIAKTISEYRQTLPNHLRNTLDSVLSRLHSLLPSCLTIAERQVPVVLGTEEQVCEEKMIQLKERISRNAVNIPKVVNRVRECVENIDKLESLDVTIHPAFRRRRIN